MLFWIFVIIAAIALIIMCVAAIPSKKEEQYEQLEEEYERQSRYESYLPRNAPKEIYQAQIAQRKEAKKRLDEFKEANPKIEVYQERKEKTGQIAAGFLIGAGCVLIIMIIGLLITYAAAPGERAKLEADYEILTWEVENQVYHDSGDDVVGKKELYNQVREWNGALKSNQYYEKDFWIGIFVPNIYGDLTPIELK